ncbi:MAG: hydrogenase maturation nickel metallochaperone HypA [Armatimonadetes bacterium]|nr:hydrogenase maturation nickel metallochaperone HypA [Armatimonadota bacterium]
MHEIAIARQILEIALKRAEQVGAKKILAVRAKIGEFTAVVPESLRFCFDAVTAGTIAEGATLDIEEIPLAAECAVCRKPFVPDKVRFSCPECGGREVEITSGRELDVESMEVE